jgi:hypothetical protein
MAGIQILFHTPMVEPAANHGGTVMNDILKCHMSSIVVHYI